MRRGFSLLLIIFWALVSRGQENGFRIHAGAHFGGPVPDVADTASSGKPYLRPNAGISYRHFLDQKFYLSTGLYYSFHRTDYSSRFRADTVVQQSVGPVLIDIPTYYYADVKGVMRQHYLTLPLSFGISGKQGRFAAVGPYGALCTRRHDTTHVNVIIGEGGFFDDVHETHDNAAGVSVFDWGFQFAAGIQVFKALSFEIRGSRSMRPLYREPVNHNPNAKAIRLYNTYFFAGLIWSVPCKKN